MSEPSPRSAVVLSRNAGTSNVPTFQQARAQAREVLWSALGAVLFLVAASLVVWVVIAEVRHGGVL